jgi:uncharacterized protein YceK
MRRRKLFTLAAGASAVLCVEHRGRFWHPRRTPDKVFFVMLTTRLVIAALACCPMAFVSGCGTMSALGNDRMWPNQVYAGTRAAAGGHATQLDIPFSVVADTIVLPYTIPRTLHNQKHPPSTQPVD